MMKLIWMIALCCSSTIIYSQSIIDCNSLETCAEVSLPIDDETGQCVFQEVIEVEGKSALQLYQLAKIWFAESFKSSQDVIQMDDAEEKVIIGKAISPLQDRGDQIWYTLKIEAKDGRYRYTMYDVEYDSGPGCSTRYREFLCQTPIEKRLNKGRRAKTDMKYRFAYVQAINDLTDGLKHSMALSLENSDW